ncbi:SRPBCC domain-containing protein [Glutamicibacter creatinolyticus]|uniref:SRPBCC family protein n=1 Tax=Glutamicibacter creatinolyticus TaxID=162496 RepID=UPI0037C0F995
MDEMTELVLTRHFAAPRTAVWAAFCEPEIIAQWWGPAGWGIKESSVVLEPKVGGRHELVMYQHQDPTQEVPLKATITEFDEYTCLVSADGPHEMTLDLVIHTRIDLKEFAGQTIVTLTQGPLPREVVASSTAAWESAFDKLTGLLGQFF